MSVTTRLVTIEDYDKIFALWNKKKGCPTIWTASIRLFHLALRVVTAF